MKLISIFSHDAGSAEIISSWCKNKRENYKFLYVLKGPAKKIFKKKLTKLNETNFLNAINRSDFVVTGTSWQSDLEYRAIKYCRKKK